MQSNIPDKPSVPRVGILLIHGIGEQCQFEHLEEVVRNIASALQVDANVASVQVNINVSQDAAYRSQQQTWRSEGTATVIIEVIDNSDQQTNLEFREVWWSDLDEPNSFKTFLSFWGWSLSLWSKPTYDRRNGKVHPMRRLPGRNPKNKKDLLPGVGESIQIFHRGYLLLVSFVVLLILPLLWALGRVLRSLLGLEIRPDLLVDYLGDVKLYQQDAREGKGPLVDLGKAPPRFSIRRRFIKASVEMSLEEYDRWYVLSHSLGTVVALNGLMEIDTTLPRYLDRKLWEKWCCNKKNCKLKRELTNEENKTLVDLLPQRPSWLSSNDDDMIDRRELFGKLKGFMTYGSPLSKFAVLWPLIVPLNKDESVFRKDFEWINVFDPTDPVSDYTRFFDSIDDKESPLNPREIPYKAEKIHLLSHGQYFTHTKRKNPLVRQVSQWLLSGDKFEEPQKPEGKKNKICDELGWPPRKSDDSDKEPFIVSAYFCLGIFVWFLLGFVISWAVSILVPLILVQIFQLLAQLGLTIDTTNDNFSQIRYFLSNPFCYLGITFFTILIVGAIARLSGLNQNRGVPPNSGKL